MSCLRCSLNTMGKKIEKSQPSFAVEKSEKDVALFQSSTSLGEAQRGGKDSG